MIIDSHAHIFPKGSIPDKLSKMYADFGSEDLSLVTPDDLIYDMDESGIDISILIGVDMGLSEYAGDVKISIGEQNKELADVAKSHPERFRAVAGIDPRRGMEGVDLLDKCVKEWGMVGLKFHPTYGFYPNERRCYPYYEKCLELGIPVFIHTGPELGVPMKYADPILVDDVAMDFPNLPIVMIHTGLYTWHWEAIGIANYRTNIYLCFSAWQPMLRRNPEEFYRIYKHMIAMVTSRRIFLGSDWPAARNMVSQKEWIEAHRNPPEWSGIKMTKERADAILGGNIARLLKIDV